MAATSEATLPQPRNPRRRLWPAAFGAFAVVASVLAFYWPRPHAAAAPEPLLLGWTPVFSQSGAGRAQTESFEIQTGQWRIKWETKRDPALPDADVTASPFLLSVHSAVSGRLMSVAVDRQGEGSGVVYLAEEPRPFFLTVQSEGLQWSVTAEEGMLGRREVAQ